MSCSLSVYRARIGTFLPNTFRKSSSIPRTPSSSLTAPLAFIIVMTLYCSLALHVNIRSTNRLENDDCIATLENNNFENIEAMLSFTNPGITRLLVGNKKIKDLLETTGTVTTISHPWCNHREMNKLMHIYNGNRERRGRGINCIYWNKGPAFLANKQLDIKTIVEEHKPHIFGLGEANVRSDHDLEDLQLSGYSLHLDSCIDNPHLGLARVAVYTHEALRVQRRRDLEDNLVAAVWLECGLPGQQGILVCVGYRQWQLPGQAYPNSGAIPEQLVRWLKFLEMWEMALGEGKEVIVTLDANLDFLTWRSDNLPPSHSSVRLRSLTNALFDKILPLGVSQLVTGATWMTRGQPKSGLDHLYSNRPDKLSTVQTFITGLSDHKLIKVTRFSRSFRQNPRYIRKRVFKDFDDDLFKEKQDRVGQ